jgi:hypothetical protein
MAHDEFPPLTRVGIEVLQSGNRASYLNLPGELPGGVRPFAAAVIREAMKQASSGRPDSCKWDALGAIADNLHALPPPPPTKDQMEIALGRLLQHTNDPAGCHEGSLIAELANVLRRGITHHCKEQP